MPRKTNSVDRLEDKIVVRPLLIHIRPDQPKDEAIAEHVRQHGPIPDDVKVILIRHTFWSDI